MVSVGTIIWLSSELMFFAALFAAYFTIRAVSPELWAQETEKLNVPFSTANTVILVASSFACQWGVFAAERPTWPRSAAKTPSWQVRDDSTRIVVLTEANGTSSSAVFWAQSSSETARIVKYDANSAAKNISSLESQMIVPTLTMLGRSWCPWSREAGIVAAAVATGVIMARQMVPRHPDPLRFRHLEL